MTWLQNNKSLVGLFAAAFALRLSVVFTAQGIADDGCGYAFLAQDILRGDYKSLFSSVWPPLYPILTALLARLVGSVEMAGQLVSCTFGSLTIFPLYFLTRDIFGGKTALFAALFFTVHPALTQASGMILTEATYFFLFTTIAWTGWIALTHKKPAVFLVTGFLILASALTRFESITLIFLILGWIWIGSSSALFRDIRFKLTSTFCCLLLFLAFFAGYSLWGYLQTGSWQMRSRILNYAFIFFTPGHPEQSILQHFSSILLSNMKVSIPAIPICLIKAYYPVLFPLLCIGCLRQKEAPRLVRGEYFILSFILVRIGTLLVVAGINERFLYAFIPIALGWAGRGALIGNLWFQNQPGSKSSPVYGIHRSFLVVLILVVASCLPRALNPLYAHRAGQKAAGLWIREHATGDSLCVASLSPQEAFYADAKWYKLEGTTFAEIVKNAKDKGAHYLVVDKDIDELCSDYSPSHAHTLLDPATSQFENDSRRIAIYHIPQPQ